MRASILSAVIIGSFASTGVALAQNEITVTKSLPQWNEQGWLLTPAPTLRQVGPAYSQPSGVRVGRGSVIPAWVSSGQFQNVNVPGLSRGGYYEYYISPDDRVVVFTPTDRRVAKVFWH
ncbi:hypothetical protein GCM10007036_30600 [Alsobacter metallidurans]|uniref:Nickel/cobalt transporter regulator n=1 Tax=Alsobacter metallidurans TaxID=340221 RepID=A0A917I9D7_9HYPH|nr:hypothetical protein [Alsobacter metallidurans]GGH24302.1 hypothetical protein GCM10007036_30600 [Alsobacter metallidurans]